MIRQEQKINGHSLFFNIASSLFLDQAILSFPDLSIEMKSKRQQVEQEKQLRPGERKKSDLLKATQL